MDKTIHKLQINLLKEYWELIFGVIPEKHIIDMWKNMDESQLYERISYWRKIAQEHGVLEVK